MKKFNKYIPKIMKQGMKLNHYIRTGDESIINDFIDRCESIGIPFEETRVDIEDCYGVGIFSTIVATKDEVKDIDYAVILLSELATYHHEIPLRKYKEFIDTFDKQVYIDKMNELLIPIKEKYPIGSILISDIDIEYKFYENDYYTPYTLVEYMWCNVNDEWGPHTSKGYGRFKGFKFYDINKYPKK